MIVDEGHRRQLMNPHSSTRYHLPMKAYLLLILFIGCKSHSQPLSFQIAHAPLSLANGIYVCASSTNSRCDHVLNHGYSLQSVFKLNSANILQKRWYVYNISSSPLYGAVQISETPFTLSSWKQLPNQLDLHDLTLVPIPNDCQDHNSSALNPYRYDLIAWSLLNHSPSPALDACILRILSLSGRGQDHTSNSVTSLHRALATPQTLTAYMLPACVYASILKLSETAIRCFMTIIMDEIGGEALHAAKTVSTHRFSVERCTVTALPPTPLSCYNATLLPDECCLLLSGSMLFIEHLMSSTMQPQEALVAIRSLECALAANQHGHRPSNLVINSGTGWGFVAGVKAVAAVLLGREASAMTDDCHCRQTAIAHSAAGPSPNDIKADEFQSNGGATRIACDRLLGTAASQSGSVDIHTLLQHVCTFLNAIGPHQEPTASEIHSTPVLLSLPVSRAIVNNLLSIGNVAAAAEHVSAVIRPSLDRSFALLLHIYGEKLLVLASNASLVDLEAWDAYFLRQNRRDKTLLPTSTSSWQPLELLAELAHDAYVLSSVEHSLLKELRSAHDESSSGSTLASVAEMHKGGLARSEVLAMLVMTLQQAASPVVLMPDESRINASTHREALYSAMTNLGRMCSFHDEGCLLASPSQNVGTRGLFLLAYQELPSVSPGNMAASMGAQVVMRVDHADYGVPELYQWMVMGSLPWPWDLPHLADSPDASPRVGFVSAFFFKHSVGRLLAQVTVELSKTFDVHIVDLARTGSPADDLTVHLQSEHKNYHKFDRCHPVECAEMIRALALDVVVFGDIFMDALTAHVAMMRLARVSVAFWGHPFTSGFGAIDYFISSTLFEPVHMTSPRACLRNRDTGVVRGSADESFCELTNTRRASHYSEQLVMFDSLTFQMYDAPSLLSSDAAVTRISFMLNYLLPRAHSLNGPLASSSSTIEYIENATFYGCLQSVFKLHPAFDAAIAELLFTDTNCVVVFQRSKQTVWMERFYSRLRRSLQLRLHLQAKNASEDLLAHYTSRVWFIDQMPTAAYQQVVCAMDVTLDPFPFGGGVTLIDSLSCNRPVPFVTSGALQSVHRLGSGIARVLDAASPSDDECAFALGTDASVRTQATSFSELVAAYAAAATKLAARRKACGYSDSRTAERKQAAQRVLYYDATEATSEWARFLKRILQE